MGRWGYWLAVAVHIVVRGKEAMGNPLTEERVIGGTRNNMMK